MPLIAASIWRIKQSKLAVLMTRVVSTLLKCTAMMTIYRVQINPTNWWSETPLSNAEEEGDQCPQDRWTQYRVRWSYLDMVLIFAPPCRATTWRCMMNGHPGSTLPTKQVKWRTTSRTIKYLKYLSLNMMDVRDDDISWFLCEAIHFIIPSLARSLSTARRASRGHAPSP